MARNTTSVFAQLLALQLIGAACTRKPDEAAPPRAEPVRITAMDGLGLASGALESLDVYVDGDVVHTLVATVLPGGNERWALYYVPLSVTGETLAAPVRVDAGTEPPHRPSHGGDPQLAVRGDNLVAVWTTKGIGHKERGPLQTAISRDGGATWQPGGEPAPVADRGGQAFIDAAADERGRFHLVWLDDRGDPKGLYHGVSDDGGSTWRVVSTIDGQTCQCCWNRLVRGAGAELYALYRDADPRDMAVVRWDGDEAWRSLGRAGSFGWAFDGCPHVGGGLAVFAGEGSVTVHATVWTGMAEQAGLFYVHHGGGSWQAPHLLAADGRHSDVAVSSDGGTVTAVWDMQQADKVRAVYAADSPDGGQTWSAPRRLSGALRAGYPRVFFVKDRFHVTWIEEHEADKTLRYLSL
jgi:hypothetical protein